MKYIYDRGQNKEIFNQLMPTLAIFDIILSALFIIFLLFNLQMGRQDDEVIYKLKKITIISMIFMFVQLLGGYYAHSIAIIADAFHLFSDVLAYVISLYAVYKSSQISPPHLTFGYDKMQPLGALLNVAIIWIVTAELFIEATKRMINNSVVEEPTYMLLTSIFGLGCNLYIMRVLHSDEHAGHHNCSHNHGDSNKAVNQIQQAHKHSNCSHGHGAHNHDHPKSREFLQEPGSLTHKCSHDHDHGHHHHHHQEDTHNQNINTSFNGHLNPSNALEELILQDKLTCERTIHSHHSNSKGVGVVLLKEIILIPNESDEEQREEKHVFQNINIEAAYIHILTDIILSIGVILSASIIYFCAPEGWSYWQLADPLCTYLFSVMAIYSTISISKESIVLLLDGCERPELIPEIRNQLQNDKTVNKIIDLRIWSTNRGKHFGVAKLKIIEGDLSEVRQVFSSRGITGFIQFQEQRRGLGVEQ